MSRCWHQERHRSKKNSLSLSYWIEWTPISFALESFLSFNLLTIPAAAFSFVSSSISLMFSSCWIWFVSMLSSSLFLVPFFFLSTFGPPLSIPSSRLPFSISSLSISIFQSSTALSYALSKSKSRIKLFWILILRSIYCYRLSFE